jgi:hypothetical protein
VRATEAADHRRDFLACRLLADRGGTPALVGFYRAMDQGGRLAPELRRWFGLTPAELVRDWQSVLSHLPA